VAVSVPSLEMPPLKPLLMKPFAMVSLLRFSVAPNATGGMCELWTDADHFEVTNDLTAEPAPEGRIDLPALQAVR